MEALSKIIGYDGPYLSVLDDELLRFQLLQIKKGSSGFYVTKEVRNAEECSFYCMVDNQENDSFQVSVKPFNSIKIAPSHHATPDKILVLADIEGNFNAL